MFGINNRNENTFDVALFCFCFAWERMHREKESSLDEFYSWSKSETSDIKIVCVASQLIHRAFLSMDAPILNISS